MTGKWETLAGESPGRLVTQGQRLRAEFTGTMVTLHRSSGSGSQAGEVFHAQSRSIHHTCVS